MHVNTGRAVEIPWVDAIVHLLRSTSRLKRMEISASPGIVSDIAGAFKKDSNLCPELVSFVVDESTQSYTAAAFKESRDKVAAFMEKRQSSMSTY